MLYHDSSIDFIPSVDFDGIIKRMLDADDRTAIGARIRSEMDRTGVTLTELAVLCDVTPQAVNGWIKTGRIAKKHLAVVAAKFRRTPSWLTTGRDLAGDMVAATIGGALAADALERMGPAIRRLCADLNVSPSWLAAEAPPTVGAKDFDDVAARRNARAQKKTRPQSERE